MDVVHLQAIKLCNDMCMNIVHLQVIKLSVDVLPEEEVRQH